VVAVASSLFVVIALIAAL